MLNRVSTFLQLPEYRKWSDMLHYSNAGDGLWRVYYAAWHKQGVAGLLHPFMAVSHITLRL